MHIKFRYNVNDNGNCMLILCFQIDFEVNEVKHLDNYITKSLTHKRDYQFILLSIFWCVDKLNDNGILILATSNC